MLSYEYIQFLNEKILEYLPHERVKIGDKINFRCPLCGDSRKSSTKKRGFWYCNTASFFCFNCSTGMSGIKFLQFLSGSDYEDIKREYLRLFIKSGSSISLSAQYDIPKEEPSIFDMRPAVKPEWKKPLSEKAKSYLAGRMVLDAPYLKEDLFSCDGKNGEYILIPWIVNGIDAYYQLNDYQKLGPMKYVFPKNRRKLLYGLDNIDVTWPYVICFEGVYDSLFVKNAVACGSKSITDYQLKLIKERYPGHQICVSFDNDTPGIEAMSKYIEKGLDVKFFRWFNQNTAAKDVNDYVVAEKNTRLFTNKKTLERLMVTPLQMKMWLIQNGAWTPKQEKTKKYTAKRQSAELDIGSRRALFE
jgi:hypothetical protein